VKFKEIHILSYFIEISIDILHSIFQPYYLNLGKNIIIHTSRNIEKS